MKVLSENTQDSLSAFFSGQESFSPLRALRILFSYPYCNVTSQFFLRTREYETGLIFVDRSRDLLEQYSSDIPQEESQQIERDVLFLKLALYDALNLWQDYLNLFEWIFREKRTRAYLSEYIIDSSSQQSPQERFGRYLMSDAEKAMSSTCALANLDLAGRNKMQTVLVHRCHCRDNRRLVIEGKLRRQQEGKNVEHLKRHPKSQLSATEREDRFIEMEQFFEYIEKSTH